MRSIAAIILLFLIIPALAQKKTAEISGKIVDENEQPLQNVSITILGSHISLISGDSGLFKLRVQANKPLALVFTYVGFRSEQRNFNLSSNEQEKITVRLVRENSELPSVVIQDERERTETGLIKINPKDALKLPTASGGIESLIKTLVGSNNELTSQYNVRGGNYDENLIYINDFEIFRPYLVNNGQQEGLSFINPELTRNINFYTGGFQAKYGDKMSSVLDIQYKKPKEFGGSVYLGLLEQGIHLEGTAKNKRLSYLVGIRNRTNQNLLASQETKGNYIPSSSDLQSLITYKINDQTQLELLGIFSTTKFLLIPESAQKSSAVFSPLFTSNLGLDIFFDGTERDSYKSDLIGVSVIQSLKKDIHLKWMTSHFRDKEIENYDITGTYLFGERDFDKSSSTFGQITNPLGAGVYKNYARDQLDINVWNISNKGWLKKGKNFFQWGAGIDHTIIDDRIHEFDYQDSAGYSLPYDPSNIHLSRVLNSTESLIINKYSGFFQNNINLSNSFRTLSMQLGIRFNYNDLNKEFLASPRIQISYGPSNKKDIIYKASLGLYHQPPFYREMIRPDGSVNTRIRSQKSFQVVTGFDYNFNRSGRPFRLTTEAYYKSLWDVVPYDIDNVRIRYFGTNNARAYATGLDLRLYTELVKDAESWLSIGLLRTREKIENEFYYNYKNASGEVISSTTVDQKVTDSSRTDVGYIRRPGDRLFTMGLFLQDYLSTNKNSRVHLNMIYGTNMPYNLLNSIKYRNGLIIEPYIRADIGFSALLFSEMSIRRSHDPLRGFQNIWMDVEVFNLINRANTISYQLIKDFANNTFTIPNRLTPRLLNIKLLAKF